MSVDYLVRVSCDHAGCQRNTLARGTTEAAASGWAMLPDGWRCPAHSEQWAHAQDDPEPTDEDLLS